MLHFDERNEFAALLIICINLDEDFKWLSSLPLLLVFLPTYASSHRKFETLKVIFKKKTISIIRIFPPYKKDQGVPLKLPQIALKKNWSGAFKAQFFKTNSGH